MKIKISFLAAVLFNSQILWALNLDVYGTNFSSGKGVYRCLIFKGPDGFPGKLLKASQAVTGVINNDEGLCSFRNLAAGTYAVSSFHDADGNGKLDVNFFGIPKERYGFSNNASVAMGPPSFAEASFELYQSDKLQIRLK